MEKFFSIRVKKDKSLFKYKILNKFKDRKEATENELLLQIHFNVVRSTSFFNESLATINGSHGRDVSGSLNPRWNAVVSEETRRKIGESNKIALKGIKRDDVAKKNIGAAKKGKVAVFDKEGKAFLIDKTDERYINKEVKSIAIGFITTKDVNGNFFRVSVTDPRYLSGELFPMSKGRKLSDEVKSKMGQSRKGIPLTENKQHTFIILSTLNIMNSFSFILDYRNYIVPLRSPLFH